MLVQALEFRCPTPKCVGSILVRYRPDCLSSYHPRDLPAGVEHREWESDDPANRPEDGFILEFGLFCTACGAQMRRA